MFNAQTQTHHHRRSTRAAPNDPAQCSAHDRHTKRFILASRRFLFPRRFSNMLDRNQTQSSTRRDFLKTSSTGILAASALQAAPLVASAASSDKLAVALIGCGGRGTHDAGLFKNTPDVELV